MPNYPALNREIKSLLLEGKEIYAIKLYREEAGVSLKEAKAYVDSLKEKENIINSIESGRSTAWAKPLFKVFIILNLILIIGLIVGLIIVGSLEYMESLFGMSEWEVDAFREILLKNLHWIPIVIATDLFLLFWLSEMASGSKSKGKSYVKIVAVLAVLSISLSYFIKTDKNQFRNPEKMKHIFENLQDKRVFKGMPVSVNYLCFFVGNIERQSSIYIVGEFDYTHYTYRPYNLFTKWKKDDHQFRSHESEYIELDNLNIDEVVPKIFDISDKLVKELNLSYMFKGVYTVQLVHTTVNGVEDWYWRSSIQERGARRNSEMIVFDIKGNVVELPDIFLR